jgi:hypothetical protein
MVIQMRNRSQVKLDKFVISTTLQNIESAGVKGTKGT